MRFSTAACLLALLGITAPPALSQAQDLVERVRAATGVKSKPAAKPAAKSKAKSKPKPKTKAQPRPKAKPKAAARAKTRSQPSKAPPEPTPAVAPGPAAAPEAAAAPDAAAAPQPRGALPSAEAPKPAPPQERSTPAVEAAPASPLTDTAADGSTAISARAASDAAVSDTARTETVASDPAAGVVTPAALEPATTNPLQLALFVDAYASWQSSGSGTLATLSNHRAFSGQGSTLRAENGFGLAFLGLDVSYAAPHWGATANLRFGEGAPIYHVHPTGESDAAFGVELLTQAYLTWRPWEVLTLDLGMFNTPFGAEGLESWRNLNYTRGALYYYAQPAWHSGLRVMWDASDAVALVGFVANGSNVISETQQDSGSSQAPTLGAQLGMTLSDALWLAAGGLFATDGYDNDDSGFDALADVVLRFEQGPLLAVLNADYALTRNGAPDGSDRHFFGVSAAAGYAFSERLGVAARGEWLLDDANYDEGERDRWRLFTVTLTTEIKPIAGVPNLILRWDNRWEESNQEVFGKDARRTADPGDDSYADVWFQTVLGVVVTTTP